IINAQGIKPFDHNALQLGQLSFDVQATESGVINGIDNLQMAKIARLAGSPKVIGAGVDLFKKLGQTAERGDALYRVYAAHSSDLSFARQASQKSSGYTVGLPGSVPHVFVEF
ncbi:MAG: thymidine phosphorylase, partial [Rhodoferax sp.]|nr:thymidine phosphorylase [Rhodoferax sp.]